MRSYYAIFLMLILLSSLTVKANDKDSLLNVLSKSNVEKQAEIYNQLALIYIKAYNTDSSSLYTNKAFSLALKYKNLDQQAEALFNFGEICENKSESKQAIVYKEKAAAIFKKLGNNKSYAICLNDMAGVYRDLGNYYKALELYNNAFQINVQNGYTKSQIVNLINMGLIYYDGLDYDYALKLYRKALNTANVLKYKSQDATIYNNIGSVYSGWGKHDSAVFYYRKSLELALKSGDQYSIGNAYNNLGYEYRLWKKYDEALEFFNQAYGADKAINYEYSIVSDYNNIGLVHLDKGDNNQARKFFQKENTLAKKLKSPYYEALSLCNLAKVYQKEGNSKNALELSEKELKLIQSYRLSELTMPAYRLNGSIWLDIKNFDEGIKSFRKSLSIAQASQQRDEILSSCKLLANAFKAKGEADSALKYLEKYNSIKDSIFTTEQHKQLAEFQAKYGLEQMEAQLALSKSENQKIKTKQKTWMLAGIFGIVGLILIIIKLYRNHVQTKRIIAFLKEQNKEIEESLARLKIEEEKPICSSVWSLSDEASIEVFQKINALLKQTKLYLNDELTLPMLAQNSKIQAHHISKAINSITTSGFSDYINSLRIEEAKKRILDPDFKLFTIEAIGRSVGFKSRTSFIAAFKKLEVITPSEYKKKVEGQYEPDFA